MSEFYFFYQKEPEGAWYEALARERSNILLQKPPFTTVLDLDSVPADNDFSKVHYRGPMYFDFDAGDDLPLVCEKFKEFLSKLFAESSLDLNCLRLYASGGKGFHIEIPEEVFRPKAAPKGTAYLPYIYREVALGILVDTLDLNVYTGKRGRMWRTANVQRSNGMFKVPLTLEEAMSITPDDYKEYCSAPRPEPTRSIPVTCANLALKFDQALRKVQEAVKGQKKRREQANKLLDKWKSLGKDLPTMVKIMNGDLLKGGVGFQKIAMQLAIYATSMGMEKADFLQKCEGLCRKHESDGDRYNTYSKRQAELSRMFAYMEDSPLYDFDAGPIVSMLERGTTATDLGVLSEVDEGETAPPTSGSDDGSDEETEDLLVGIRRGFIMNSQGMFKKTSEGAPATLSRVIVRNPEAMYDADTATFQGYEVDVILEGRPQGRTVLSAEALMSSVAMRKFLMGYQTSFQGGDQDTSALLDIIQEKARLRPKTYSFTREGLFVMNHPDKPLDDIPVICYLTKDLYQSSIPEGHPDFFHLRYRPNQATSSYNCDIHHAPELCAEQGDQLENLFKFNRKDMVARLLGWFVAAHYRSFYLHMFRQFPLLQVYGEAGSGKSQTILLLGKLHWFRNEVRLPSALALTAYALDQRVSSSTSVPLLLDEYKPREMRQKRGSYEKLKDVLKQSYVGGDAGERGSLNKMAENSMTLIGNKCTAPICFMGEAIEMETAIFERCVLVNLTKEFQTDERTAAFEALNDDTTPLSSLGRAILEKGYSINITKMREEMRGLIKSSSDYFAQSSASVKIAPRVVYNHAITVHGLMILQRVLNSVFGNRFDEDVQELLSSLFQPQSAEAKTAQMHGMSEISKVVSRLALLSRESDVPYEMRPGKEYLADTGWVEIKVERSYDQYRRYCAAIHDTPLFDTVDAFFMALLGYSPTVDTLCASSDLRRDDSTERVVRLDTNKLLREGVQSFR